MECNIILAGVGGQGILTIAQVITQAAARRGLHVKQSEVHGMSQRGGAVQAHVRLADRPVYSELIPLGEADLILAAEPLEALRYTEYLRPRTGAVVTSSEPVRNIGDYPLIESVLERVTRFGNHVILDAAATARAAGSARAENMAILGAASAFLPLVADDLCDQIAETFATKGGRVVDINRDAFRLGREAATRSLGAGDPGDAILETAAARGRTRLFEHEVYQLLESEGVSPPAQRFVPADTPITEADLETLPSDLLVLKLVSADVVHKTEVGGVAVVPRDLEAVRQAVRDMSDRQRGAGARVEGVLVVEHVGHPAALGGELFIGIRVTREFGPVIAAGLGGTATEFLAERLRSGSAIAMASALETSADEFLALFRQTAAYEIVSGQARGERRTVEDDELLRCFDAMLRIARRFCTAAEADDALRLIELEVNPFAVAANGRLVPLDGRATLGQVARPASPRPLEHVRRMIEPRSIAVVGVSATRANFGRIIVNNIQACGFPADHLHIVKGDADRIDGVRCVPSIGQLPEPVDLLVAAVSAEQVPHLVRDAMGRCRAVILISGGVGEREGTQHLQRELRETIAAARGAGAVECPVFLGANCMGVRSRPGCYDTFFIPPHKCGERNRDAAPARLALVSQSGAFNITRMSNLPQLEPAVAVSLGNQLDLAASDMLRVLAERRDVEVIGTYVEGFNDLDGIEFARAVRAARSAGKTVVFYKAGRTPAGRAATASHTASLAGDWHVCRAILEQAGALLAYTFEEFEHLLELATRLHDKHVGGRRIGAISNAGFETVGMADALGGERDHRIEMPEFRPPTCEQIHRILTERRLDQLVTPRNPLDLTPMADDEAYERAARAMLAAEEFDAVVVGCVPMTPQLLTTPQEITRPGSLAKRIVDLFRTSAKPLVFVVDAGSPYDVLASTVRSQGVPVFRSADTAVRALGRYLCHRARAG